MAKTSAEYNRKHREYMKSKGYVYINVLIPNTPKDRKLTQAYAKRRRKQHQNGKQRTDA